MIDLDDPGALARIDQGGLLAALEGFPAQCARAIELEEEPPLSPDFKRLIIAGMGGSGIAGELLARLVELPVPVSVHHGYGLPAVDREALVVAISYSGDTEETLSSVEQALQARAKLLCLSSGGELERLARERALPFIKVPGGLQPRAALGYLLLPLLSLLDRLGYRQLRDELARLPGSLSKLKGQWQASSPGEGNRAKRLARGLYRRIPLIYGVEGATEAVALRWKTQFNENSKQPAFWNAVPELCHNELVGFEAAGLMPNTKVLFLRSGLDHPRNRVRIDLLKELLAARGVEHEEVWAEGEGRLAQLFSLIYLGDFVSFYLAMLNGVDPSPVRPISELKRRLGRRP
ncbi:MAG: bifunctional phosphoglucose/phosphomannose isomerase [Candidatus Bipolaricaulia bacterium]